MKHTTPAWITALCQDLQRTENMWVIDGEAMMATLHAECPQDITAWPNLWPVRLNQRIDDEGGEG